MPAISAVIDSGLARMLALYGETIVYVPYGGSERSISAVVRRVPTSLVGPTNAYAAASILVTVANNATSGISSSELNLGQDNIKVAQRPGQAQESRPVARVVQVNDSLLQLEVR